MRFAPRVSECCSLNSSGNVEVGQNVTKSVDLLFYYSVRSFSLQNFQLDIDNSTLRYYKFTSKQTTVGPARLHILDRWRVGISWIWSPDMHSVRPGHCSHQSFAAATKNDRCLRLLID